ncbi:MULTISPECIES: MFS transporter [Rathayibacter]|uniref:MFS transporter n=2 Tax=Rathayibacter festucae TaxID=110937 RepID=A0A3T0T1N0_9MICO|nr:MULTISPECIES: MFS transporter [Rathayibacter]AZZ52534.1 MFS transporter [Rathayibacter festucae DSM 15932]QHC62098.1 MFS transporter [Rathayibacter festucae]ROS25240.1 putative MFS family arabinose efflux permease [Rathayibacter sp. PhB127]TDX76536.1 putative MFS family arabinose efflux permease [Rathayibacter sp. PhB151]
MGSYTELLRTPGVGRIIAAQLTARFPFGMLSLAFLLHVERVHDSYAAAGLVLGSMSIGQAIAGPLTSRLMGRLGMRRVLTATLIVCAAAIIAMAVLPLEIWQFVVIGFVSGLSMPPVQPAVRTIYPKMVPSSQLTPLFSLDASAQEIIWVLGPVLTTFVSIQISTVAGILTAAFFLVGGGIWFIASPEVGRVRIPRSRRKLGVVLTKPPVLLATVVGFLLVGACAAVEAGVVAVFGEGGVESGVVLAIFAAGSLLGGLTLGHIPISRWATARRMLIVTVGMGLAAFSTDFWWLSITLFLAGVGIAPALAALFTITAASVKFSDTAEAYGWVGTGQLIGAALGSAIAGVQIDRSGPTAAIVVAAVFAFVGFVVPALGRRFHPDLRGRDASPLPDTEPVELPT